MTGRPSFFSAGPDELFAGAHGRRRLEATGGRVGRVFEAVVLAENTNEHLGLVVVGREVLVAQRPVEAEAVARTRLEIVGAIAERDAAPVIRATAHHAGTPPPEFARRIVGRTGVGFTRHLPAAIDRRVVETEGLVRRARSAQGRVAVDLKHRRLRLRDVAAAGFEHEDLCTLHHRGVSRLAAGGAGADDDEIITGLGLARSDNGHGDSRGVGPAISRSRFAKSNPAFPACVIAPARDSDARKFAHRRHELRALLHVRIVSGVGDRADFRRRKMHADRRVIRRFDVI